MDSPTSITDVSASPGRLLPDVAAHVERLASTPQTDTRHRDAVAEFAAWIAANDAPGKPLHVIAVCTGNSRRSLLTSTMGNIAAACCGLDVRFHSGGTIPSAFNPRTIKTLQEIGVEVEATGEEAPRGEPGTANPVYRVRWGRTDASSPPMEMREFSKRYDDAANPQQGFAALMVCGEADEACPVVSGAALRVSMPFPDPKIHDGTEFEAAGYRERRDEIGRLMLGALQQARQRLTEKGRL